MALTPVAELCLKGVISPEPGKTFLLHTLFTLQHLLHGRGHIVIDQPEEHAVEKDKSMDMAVKQGLLPLHGISPDKAFPSLLRPPGRHPDLPGYMPCLNPSRACL